MSKLEVAMCTNAPWRWFARKVVLPWGLHGFAPRGDVLEIGAGSGAMAAELLTRYADVRVTATDFDEVMVRTASKRLAPFGDRVTVRQADATALPFADASFDAVVSWIMLHHTGDWQQAIREALRVLKAGGRVVGYDLYRGKSHVVEPQQLVDLAHETGAEVTVAPGFGRSVVRFALTK
jgi:ubiquinone/menaquinone biosynthesis C-methylase UbiE